VTVTEGARQARHLSSNASNSDAYAKHGHAIMPSWLLVPADSAPLGARSSPWAMGMHDHVASRVWTGRCGTRSQATSTQRPRCPTHLTAQAVTHGSGAMGAAACRLAQVAPPQDTLLRASTYMLRLGIWEALTGDHWRSLEITGDHWRSVQALLAALQAPSHKAACPRGLPAPPYHPTVMVTQPPPTRRRRRRHSRACIPPHPSSPPPVLHSQYP